MKKILTSLILASSFSSFANAQMIKSVTSPNPTTPISTKSLNNTSTLPTNVKTSLKNQNNGYTLEGFQLGIGAGILGGANVQLGYRIPQRSYNFWKNRFGFRIEYNTWKPFESIIEEETIKVDDNEFTAQITGDNFGALLDFYPFGNTWGLGNFRITAGYYSGDFSIGGNLTKYANETFSIYSETLNRDITYTVNGEATLSANLDYDVKGPYAGIGFDIGLLAGLKMYFDAGIVFTDKPILTSNITGTGTLTIDGGSPIDIDTSNSQIQDLLYDTVNQYQEELNDITKEYFPMIKLGFLYRF